MNKSYLELIHCPEGEELMKSKSCELFCIDCIRESFESFVRYDKGILHKSKSDHMSITLFSCTSPVSLMSFSQTLVLWYSTRVGRSLDTSELAEAEGELYIRS